MAGRIASAPPSGGRVCVVGAGFMGCVIATLYARHGYDVVICDSQAAMLESYAERARPIAASFSDDSTEVEAMVNRVATVSSLKDAVAGAFMVHEAVQEVLETKQAVFEELDRLCPPDVVLASNTSSFLISDIAEGVSSRERVLGIHYITPGHIIPVIEIIHSSFTPPELIDWARAFIHSIDHVGVACPERPGFLINKIQFAMLTEVYRLVDEGLASRDDIDAAVRLSLGPRLALWGPLLTEDLIVSKKTALAVTDSLYEQTGDENYKGRKALRDLVERGDLGLMTGQGWYAFEGDRSETIMERDRQLTALFDWLREANAVDRLKVE
ncbi:putative 3-hydroxybutyryl-CoA dehydrogenase [Labrenzia sp. THAF191b]|uniref:3-hydroxyacyl-CoA dehydrogenase family protein n=1 Tax=Stappiaceae TaxID=2821832 RepID=UPI001267ACC5|nr:MULTISPECIES: 3-hydroxyacyl-CoA dehydrogenase family protein [Stappiaceae]MCR9283373.1 3-hydroxyacyl-CoA dehydrogenase family protein [Paracoccaceae bacterium]MBO9421627.1 3-hydroxyacyl-CoA dehydrogenase family protein [Labrenzia sp. R4_2]QFS97209.1 putative 3-hydroxybutyryl-CoA dehydrogenase [Labrenzia sp. THAF191b]QFT03524.1 putative 3-hydroxybutyryl-CoA dehydrogenase [Labrenzia sp. THAF191a]QFT15066.1 putative 3-hydroxybutyryl-CoA dehydrogenase [Labrenzia sp. THAF187b]